jgi:hypothetical protein
MLAEWYARNFGAIARPATDVDGEPPPPGSFEVLFKGDEYAWGMFVPTGSTLYEEKQISIISTDKIEKAYKMLTELGSNPQPLQTDGDGYRFFEIKDLDGNSLQVSEEP